MLKKWWKYSRWRFYLINLKWNYGFWLGCKKMYHQFRFYKKNENDFHIDPYGKMHFKQEPVSKPRFKGFMYKGMIVDDNPGPKIDRETWVAWRKKGLIKL